MCTHVHLCTPYNGVAILRPNYNLKGYIYACNWPWPPQRSSLFWTRLIYLVQITQVLGCQAGCRYFVPSPASLVNLFDDIHAVATKRANFWPDIQSRNLCNHAAINLANRSKYTHSYATCGLYRTNLKILTRMQHADFNNSTTALI